MMTAIRQHMTTKPVPIVELFDEVPDGAGPRCRLCGAPLHYTLVDLGMSPLCESYVARDQLNRAESFYPLHVYVCDQCHLAQLEEYVAAEEIFTEYAYFSSYSDSWVEHALGFARMSAKRFRLGANSQVVELASNDGYLLQHFLPLSIRSLASSRQQMSRRRPLPGESRPSSGSSTGPPRLSWLSRGYWPTS